MWKELSSGRLQALQEGLWGTVKHLLQELGIPQKTSICLIPIPVDLVLVNVPPTS